VLSIRFDQSTEWWVSSAVFERLFNVGLAEGDIPAGLTDWQHVASANGGFGLERESPETSRALAGGIISAARKELARVTSKLTDVDESEHPVDWTYRESLKKLLAQMRDNDGCLIAHLEQRFDEARIAAALSTVLQLAPEFLATVERADDSALLPYQVFQRATGFLTTVEVYAGPYGLPTVPLSDAGFALLLARHLHTDAAVCSPSNQWSWYVIHPDGSVSEGTEAETDGDVLILENIHAVAIGTIELR